MSIIPPPEKIYVGKGAEEFISVGNEFLGLFRELCGLRPDETVLDAGCGIGRMAVPLTEYLTSGQYYGFDVVKNAIKWCQDEITSRYPNFHFSVSDIYNKRYNKSGKYKASEYRFEFDANTFDFVFLASVFTHMLPDDINNYLSEIHRVLKPGGRCLITWFDINTESENLVLSGKGPLRFFDTKSGYYAVDSDEHEAAVAYTEQSIQNFYKKNSLEIKGIFYGSWCERSDYTSFQDVVVAQKLK